MVEPADTALDQYERFRVPEELRDRYPEDWSDKEAKWYLGWFLSQIPRRLSELEKLGRATSQSFPAHLDFTPWSLKAIGAWMPLVMKNRVRKREEWEESVSGLTEHQRLLVESVRRDPVLTATSKSICHDVGIYLGEVVRRNNPATRWEVVKQQSYAGYHRPAILGLRVSPWDPIIPALTVGGKTADGNEDPDMLWRLATENVEGSA